jgi:hypothetical protein
LRLGVPSWLICAMTVSLPRPSLGVNAIGTDATAAAIVQFPAAG